MQNAVQFAGILNLADVVGIYASTAVTRRLPYSAFRAAAGCCCGTPNAPERVTAGSVAGGKAA